MVLCGGACLGCCAGCNVRVRPGQLNLPLAANMPHPAHSAHCVAARNLPFMCVIFQDGMPGLCS